MGNILDDDKAWDLALLRALPFFERRPLAEPELFLRHALPFALQKIGDGAAEARVSDVVR